MLVRVKVERVTLDTATSRFVVILKDEKLNRWLPIVVGSTEAQAIALQLEKVTPPRPMTHDLLKSLLDTMQVNVTRVVVNDLRENTYFATIDMKRNGTQSQIDARPSDAIALALRSSAPIFVEEDVMQKASIGEDLELDEPTIDNEDDLNLLNTQLQKAVDDERYEDAARIRDQINEMEQKKTKQN